MKKVTIIGYGRFGKTLRRLLQDDFDVTIYTRKGNVSLQQAYQNEIIFYAVPIAAFEEVIKTHQKYFRPEHLLIDVLSVKLHPKIIFETYLKKTKTQALLTHPLFGPDSSSNGFINLPIMMNRFKTKKETYDFWKNYFKTKQLNVIEMTAENHDKLAADSQGLTHFVGRLLDEFTMKQTPIDTNGAKKLREVTEQTCHDTWELFTQLQQYNPYTKQMRLKLGKAYDKLYNKLIPKQQSSEKIVIGIQGGKGSFNEAAIRYYIQRNNLTGYHINYLHTSEAVLKELHEGSIDQGLFAMHNSIGGIVMESVTAMAKYTFTIVEEFAIIINHALMIRNDAKLKDITTIMTHPQVFAQCKTTLEQKYPRLTKISGAGELIDHALVAKQLSGKKLPKHIAVMGSSILADIYGLTIIEDQLQDMQENYTSFLLVER
jgi:arogenate dehydrogenase (NADP+), plant